MQELTQSGHMETLMEEMIRSIPWDMYQDTPLKLHDWVMFDEHERDLPEEYLHLKHVDT